jgi:hypothetical protein
VRGDPLALLADEGIEHALVSVDGVPNLRVLGAPPAGTPETIVQAYARRLPEIVDRARPFGRFIVIDTPPIGQVAEALLLAARADDVMLVARPGQTDRRDLAAAQLALKQLAVVPTGLIVVSAAPRVSHDLAVAEGTPVAPAPRSPTAIAAEAGPDR